MRYLSKKEFILSYYYFCLYNNILAYTNIIKFL